MARKMPKAGFWLEMNDPEYPEVIHTTGEKRGNHYLREGRLKTRGWCALTWTCVPTMRDGSFVHFASWEALLKDPLLPASLRETLTQYGPPA